MHEMQEVSWEELMRDCKKLAHLLPLTQLRLWGVPRGGQIISAIMSFQREDITLVGSPKDCDIIIDDVCETGETLSKSAAQTQAHPLQASLYVRSTCPPEGFPDYCARVIYSTDYILLPWEER